MDNESYFRLSRNEQIAYWRALQEEVSASHRKAEASELEELRKKREELERPLDRVRIFSHLRGKHSESNQHLAGGEKLDMQFEQAEDYVKANEYGAVKQSIESLAQEVRYLELQVKKKKLERELQS